MTKGVPSTTGILFHDVHHYMWIYQIRHQRDQLYFVSLVESSLRTNHHVGRSGDQNALKGIPRYCHEYFLEIRTQILQKCTRRFRYCFDSWEIPCSMWESRRVMRGSSGV